MMYQCDEKAKQCMQVAPNATGHKYQDNATCAKECPAKPMPMPYEMRGIWRGLAIQNSYVTGEWVANITNDTVGIWYPDASTSQYATYLKGSATAYGVGGRYSVVVDSTEGKYMGTVSMLAADFGMKPETSGFIQLGINENSIGQEVASFDDAMKTATVLSFETCPAGGTPAPPPGPPPPPPPCKAKLDVVVIVDGSASISSSDWQRALAFVNKLVGGFQIAKDQVELGVVQFSSQAATVIDLSDDATKIQAAVTQMSQMQQNTNTYSGFAQAKHIIDTEGRPNTDGKLVLILTDGVQNQGQPAKQVSDALKAENVTVFGVGVGSQVQPSEIKSWCSAPVSDHYFSVSSFAALEKIIQKIIQSACPPHPPPPPPADEELFGPPVPRGKNCKFHLPRGLKLTSEITEVERLALPVFRAPVQEAEVEHTLTLAKDEPLFSVALREMMITPNSTDSCNQYSKCDTCIGQHAAGQPCGWCTGDLKYAGGSAGPGVKCAGGGPKFTCTGHFQTSTCEIPGGCGLKGVYRGLRIDNDYTFGEWSMSLKEYNNSEQVKITSLDAGGKTASTLEGKLVCNKKCDEGVNNTGVPFTLTTTGGSIRHGICGFTHEAQAETRGLMWALSGDGVGTPPVGFDEAMLNTSNATVHTYYKCAESKGPTCKFKAL